MTFFLSRGLFQNVAIALSFCGEASCGPYLVAFAVGAGVACGVVLCSVVGLHSLCALPAGTGATPRLLLLLLHRLAGRSVRVLQTANHRPSNHFACHQISCCFLDEATCT